MKIRTKRMVIFFLIALFITAGFALSSYAKQASKGQKTTQVTGYCCLNGKVFPSVKDNCLNKKGHFFTGKKAAAEYCDAQITGYCCLDGKLFSMKKGDCLEKKGHFFKDKKAASTYCDLHQEGFCCLKGKLFPMTKGDCLNRKGKFFKDKKAARDTCDPLGWCLLKGTINHLRKSACEKKNGRFFAKKAEADRAAQKAKGNKKGTAPGIGATSLTHKGRPFLTVEKLYLKKSEGHLHVCVEIKNSGKGSLTVKDYNQGFLDLRSEGEHYRWRLSRVDRNGKLTPGNTVIYLTPYMVGDLRRVQISFSHVPGRGKSAVLAAPTNKLIKSDRGIPAGSAKRSGKPVPMRIMPKNGGAAKGGGISLGTSSVSGGSASDRILRFPARITRVSSPIYPGTRITITGNDFGYRRGQVRVLCPAFAVPVNLDTFDWSETRIVAEVPRHFASHIHGSPMTATLIVYPARVPDRVTPPSSTEGEEAMEEYRGYHYNGHEGPSVPIRIEPITPRITSFSSTEIGEGDHLDIRGNNFGRSGTLTLLNGTRHVPFTLNGWGNTLIRITIPFTALEPFGNPENAVLDARVENEYHNETTANNAFTISRVDNYDLSIAGIRVSNYGVNTTWGVEHPHFDVVPIVRNNGPDRSTGTIIIGTYSDVLGSRDRWEHRITSSLAAESEGNASSHRIGLKRTHGIYVQIEGLRDGLHSDDPGNNACHFNVTHNGVYMCETPTSSGR